LVLQELNEYKFFKEESNVVISPTSIYQQQELHVLVTVSLFMDLTITYEYQSPILAMI